ncbi:PilZ domain-containing protein [Rhizobiales bacterium]|uniref:PilZ domain-containing protein n=1 Tax=Hongsoonwoonella zoysiae TaxID=2821844 RepID=UPI0015609FDC|nr:PilZ domain-containing protein [Hongsoonwoonella zoysiae]NRG18551.1 PilZ domain-containing protein [Hongsoonwoonella zoysiae]
MAMAEGANAGLEARKIPRADCEIAGKIIDGAREIDCVIENLSVTGCGIRTEKPLEISGAFSLSIPQSDTRLYSVIVWAEGCKYGLKFLHPKSQQEIELVE